MCVVYVVGIHRPTGVGADRKMRFCSAFLVYQKNGCGKMYEEEAKVA